MPPLSTPPLNTPTHTPSPIYDYDVYKERGVINNRYQKIEDISKGSYGYVSLATDLKEQNLVAIKYIFKLENEMDEDCSNESNKSKNGNDCNRYSNVDPLVRSKLSKNICFEAIHEVDILTKIGNEGSLHNIIKLVDYFDSYIVMEYCMGGDLYDNIKSDIVPKSTKMITHLGLQMINAVEFAHKQKVYHRDIKPENILISNVKNWTIKLTDWGLATTEEKSLDRDVGSERYMAPELFESNLDKSEVNEPYECSKVDIWAIGIVLLNMVFHKNPFVVANQTDKAFCYFAGNREALFDVFPLLTPDFFQVLLFSLAIDPQHRDLNAMKEELQKIQSYTFDDDIYNKQEQDMFAHIPNVNGQKQETQIVDAVSNTNLNTNAQMLTPDPSSKKAATAAQKKDHNVIHYETQPLNISNNNNNNNTTNSVFNSNRKHYFSNIEKGKRKPLAIPTPNSHINKYFDDYKLKKQQNTFNTRDFFTPPSVKNKYLEGIFNSPNNGTTTATNKKTKVWTPSTNTAGKFHEKTRRNSGTSPYGSFNNGNGNGYTSKNNSARSINEVLDQADVVSAFTPASATDTAINTMTYHEYHHLKQQEQQQQQQQGSRSGSTTMHNPGEEEVLFTLEEDELDSLNDDFTQFQLDEPDQVAAGSQMNTSSMNLSKNLPELLQSPPQGAHATPAMPTPSTNTFGTSLATGSFSFKERQNSSSADQNAPLVGSFNGNRTPRSSFNDSSVRSGFFTNKRPSSSQQQQLQSGYVSFKKTPKGSYVHEQSPVRYSQFGDNNGVVTDTHQTNTKKHFFSNNMNIPVNTHNTSSIKASGAASSITKPTSFREPNGPFFRQLGGYSASTVEKSDVFAKRRQSNTANISNPSAATNYYSAHFGSAANRDHDVLVFSDDDEDYLTKQHSLSNRRRSSARRSSRGPRGSVSHLHNASHLANKTYRKNSIQDDLVGSLEQYKNNWVMLQQQQQD